MKTIKLAVAAAAPAFVAGTVALGGTASAGPLPAARTTAPAVHATRPAGQAAAAGAWGKARQVPGLAALNLGNEATVNQVSCASPGNCAAGGFYTDAQKLERTFVADEKNGTWHNAQKVPGLRTLNKSGAGVSTVSCASAGNCAAAGFYIDGQDDQHVFVADEKNGTWQHALTIPGFGTLNPGGTESVTSLSCPSPGNCAVGGFYFRTDSTEQAFVADEKNGTWGQAIEVPGTGALNGGGRAETVSVSCPSPGTCAAGGYYEDSTLHFHPFVADETGGQWGQEHDISVTGVLNTIDVRVTSVSCASADNCAVTGDARDASFSGQVFVADEVGGTWGPAQQIPGFSDLNVGNISGAQSISCASPGNCATGGGVAGLNGPVAYVADERSGGWDQVEQLFGTLAFNTSSFADFASVSCGSLGNCAAGGSYLTADNSKLPYVVNEVNGSWGGAHNVPGIAALATGGLAQIFSVSCASAGNCAAGGFYADAHGDHAFIANQSTP